MYTFLNKKKSGFTLVEIVVVVAIIGLLTGLIIASVSTVRKQTRDKEAMTNLKQMQLAVELYREINGVYPPKCPNQTLWAGGGSSEKCDNPGDDYAMGLTPHLIQAVPIKDPGTNSNRDYLYWSNGTEYKLIYNLSVERLKIDVDDEFARRPDPSSCPVGAQSHQNNTYAVYFDANPDDGAGAECR